MGWKPSPCGHNLLPLPRQSSRDSREGETMEAGTRYPSTGRSTQLTEGERAGAPRAGATRPKGELHPERPVVPAASIPGSDLHLRARTADPAAAASSSSSSSLDKMAAAGSAGSLARPPPAPGRPSRRPARPRPRSRSRSLPPPPAPRGDSGGRNRPGTKVREPTRPPPHQRRGLPPAEREQHQAPGP